jgi:hypothetical protein
MQAFNTTGSQSYNVFTVALFYEIKVTGHEWLQLGGHFSSHEIVFILPIMLIKRYL